MGTVVKLKSSNCKVKVRKKIKLGLFVNPVAPPLKECSSLAPGTRSRALGEFTRVVNRGQESASISISRFGDEPGTRIGLLAPGRAGGIQIPPDRSDRPWRIASDSSQPLLVCR